MIVFGERSSGERTRFARNLDGEVFHRSDWMNTGQDQTLSPNMFLVEQPPNAVLRPHYHRQNQFQLFVDGSGTIGRTALRPYTAHYAGAFTGYGPLVAGPQGLKYFTFRTVYEIGLIPAEDREQMVRGPKRHETVGPIDLAAPGDDARPCDEALLESPGCDLEVRRLRLAPMQLLVPRPAPGSQGAVLFVLQGEVDALDRELGRWESVFVTCDEAWPAITAGRQGAEALLLCVPPRASEYRDVRQPAVS
jgi:hypothetical protein